MQQFGNDEPVVDYARVVEVLKGVQPRALTPDQIDDVATMIDWMRDEILRQNAELSRGQQALLAKQEAMRQREAELDRRAKELAAKSRIVHAAAGLALPHKRWGILGR